MNVNILDRKTGYEKPATIELIQQKELPLKKDGWNFNWRKLFTVEGSEIFKLSLVNTPEIVEGILMLTLFNDEMVFMNNIEVAPQNIEKSKQLDHIAGCLLAFACKQSFEKGKGNYQGFLSFDSKTALIEFYQNKYGATWAIGHKMFFDTETGKKLMNHYLGISK